MTSYTSWTGDASNRALAGDVESGSVNPDPERYRKRPEPTFNRETCETLGIIESWWEPREEGEEQEAGGGDAGAGSSRRPNRQPLSLPRDLRGYRPLRLAFGLPHPSNEMTDDWFEVLFSALHELLDDFAVSCFGAVPLVHGAAGSPWADPALPPSFILYASDIARKDNHDGGWDALLVDPWQRAAVVQGVLAKLLNEHVFSALLFGGTADQKDALSQWDRIMIKEEGYKRKFKRCEEVQYFLGGRTLTLFFWADVDRLTAQAAQLLLPLVNLQRAEQPALGPPGASGPGLRTLYQRLHDIVALAGYASLCMAWSTSIFEVEFPEPGQMWDIDQDREGDAVVYNVSLARARDADRDERERQAEAAAAAERSRAVGDEGAGGGTREKPAASPLRVPKVKIVLWPRIARYKPHWDSRRAALRGATRTVLTKSRNAYYSGRARDAAEDAENWPDLYEHVAMACAARRQARWAAKRRRVETAGLLLVLVAAVALHVSGVGLGPLRAKLSGLRRLLGDGQGAYYPLNWLS